MDSKLKNLKSDSSFYWHLFVYIFLQGEITDFLGLFFSTENCTITQQPNKRLRKHDLELF